MFLSVVLLVAVGAGGLFGGYFIGLRRATGRFYRLLEIERITKAQRQRRGIKVRRVPVKRSTGQ